MAETQTIARPYADAAFKVALEAGQLPQWSDAIGRLASVMQTPEARQLVSDPHLQAAKIGSVIADAAGQLSAEQRNFVQLLAQNDRLTVLPEIAAQYTAQRHRHEDVLDVKVHSAYPLTEAQIADITSTLSQKYGRRIQASVDVDSSLIGGVSIQVGDEVIDASVRGKLARLAATLTK
jgi:F-type H+-transporting ATPase subunit delta